MDPLLFTPLELRGLRLRNRIVLSPMLTYSAERGFVNDFHLMHLGKFAVGGTGLVFFESTKVDPRGCTTARDLGLWKDEFVAPMARIVAFLKAHGAATAIQLGHSGRKARSTLPWEGRVPSPDLPGVDHGEEWELVGPSAVPHADGFPVPRELTRAEVKDLVEAWGKAAERANRAGFDVVEIHGAHGYLIHQFLSEHANRRTDEYGGSFANRMRFALEIAERVRASWPAEKPLFFRASAVDEEGWRIEDSIALARELKARGVDVIDCSSGGMTARSAVESVRTLRYGYQVEYAAAIREGAGIATMAVGLIIHADQAEQILRTGQADLVALGRELLHNPNWPVDAAEKLGVGRLGYGQLPRSYGYWLEKRAGTNYGGRPSTWQVGIGDTASAAPARIAASEGLR
ncbi:MAG: NADH:flavin oxidoreductase/NADH oxidase [Acetobacteraceae bacterium]|nr:NADH:flavin oxidoreductase/NADH oxidase [Acetobacteraceae bacterium]